MQLQQYQRAKVDPPANLAERQTDLAEAGNSRRGWVKHRRRGWTRSRENKREEARSRSPQPGRRYGILRCVHYPTHRVMSRRRYGVSSDGNKFKRWSRLPEWGFEAFRLPEPGKVSGESNSGESAEDGVPSEGEPSRGDPEEDEAAAEDKPAEEEVQERKEVQEEALGSKEVTTNPQDSAGSAGGEAGEKEVPVGGPSQGEDQEDPAYVSASTPKSTSASGSAPASARASTPASTSGPAPVTGRASASALDPAPDSAPASAAAPAAASASAPAQVSAAAMKITVRRGRKITRTFTVNSSGRVADLQRKIHSWCEVAPGDQRLFYNGIPLPPTLGLDSLWDGISITMAKGMHDGAGFLR